MTGFYIHRGKKRTKNKNIDQWPPRGKYRGDSKDADDNRLERRDCDQRADINSVTSKENNVSYRPFRLPFNSQAQSSPAAEQLNIFVNIENPKSDPRYARPRTSQGCPSHVPGQMSLGAVQQHSRDNERCQAAADFTSDHLPQTGVIVFSQSLETSSPKCQTSKPLASSASAGRGPGAEAPRHINEMLWQFRRELGVRELCRREREARKQTSGATVAKAPQLAGGSLTTEGEEGVPHITSAVYMSGPPTSVGSRVPYPGSGADPSTIAPAFKVGQGGPRTREVRIAHKSKWGLEAKEASSRLSVKEVTKSVKRKRAEEAKSTTR